jgi:hypothetical protein
VSKALPVYVFDNKRAADKDGFGFDLAAWLGDSDAVLGTPTATISPSSATVETVVLASPVAVVWVSGGVAGTQYTIDLHVQTVTGRDCHIRGAFGVEA